MNRLSVTLTALAVFSCALADELPKTAIFTIPEYSAKDTPGSVHLASVTKGVVHEVLHRADKEQPAAHRWLKEGVLAKQVKEFYSTASKRAAFVADANLIIGRLEGSGVGPNSSYLQNKAEGESGPRD
jgi:hypothetical protein